MNTRRTVSRRLIPISIMLAVTASGCSTDRPNTFVDDFSPDFQAESASTLQVPTLDWSDFPELRRQMQQQGHVLVVNFWATWCGPCVEEFPDLMRLQKTYWDRGVRVATISMDEIGDLEEKVKPFLFGQQVVGGTYFMSDDWPPDFTSTLSETWFGGIPQTLVYAPDGERVASLTGKRSYGEFQRAVEQALEQEDAGR